ncbi:hypothetical protein [Roseovarius marisflavi]|uniref:hypothetical protein n=1 Tax=Roseovarius marisflavi TaxID=1054996 RepID=UPI001C65A5FA|nr:hypothetical protein [Roseovarius marisflavi]
MLRPFLERGVQPDDALDATLENFDTQTLKLLLEQGADVQAGICDKAQRREQLSKELIKIGLARSRVLLLLYWFP